MEQLDRWFILEKLLLSCELKAREKPLAEHYDIWLLPEIRARQSPYTEKNAIETAYRQMLDLLEKETNHQTYFQLKTALLDKCSPFTRPQQQNILQSLINYAIQQGNLGTTVFLQENLELYQFGLDQDLLLDHDQLNDMTYLNIINIALRTGAFDWCRAFIDQYALRLKAGVRHDARSLGTALWSYALDQPKDTIDLLLRVDFHNVYYQIQARVLLLKLYFEAFLTDDTYYELAVSQAEAFIRFLERNNKVSGMQRKALLNFAANVKRLVKLMMKDELQPGVKASLHQEMGAMTLLYNKAWLLRQLA